MTMPSHLTLTLPPELGGHTVAVDNKRFSIGRTPENDLCIEDGSLSRRHALIENFEGRFNLSDCGSSNGTLVNGTVVSGLTELSDWDVLSFGTVGDILVRIERDSAAQPAEVKDASSGFTPSPAINPARSRSAGPIDAERSWLSVPVIAVASALIIILVAGVALLISKSSNSRVGSKPAITKQPSIADDNNNDNSARLTNDSAPSPGGDDSGETKPGVADSTELTSIEAYASNVLTGISRDRHPVLTARPLAEINSQVQKYKGSASLAEELRAMKRVLPQVSIAAKSNGLTTPLAVYATLARIDQDGGRADPAQVAGSLCPSLAKMRAIFGDETFNDSLLSVAALEEGASLQSKITKLAGRVNDSVATIRSVWYLHDHQIISDQTHNFVLRFIAIGVIAQDPRKFGIAADPLTF
jgi:pSer/pThr/pTyr-binding forkhead associated (FHA) protein